MPAFNEKVNDSITHHYAQMVPLLISKNRLSWLQRVGKIVTYSLPPIQQPRPFLPAGSLFCHGHKRQFGLVPQANLRHTDFGSMSRATSMMMTKLNEIRDGYWVHVVDGRTWAPVIVLANMEGLPLTADYDLFAICPHLRGASGYRAPVPQPIPAAVGGHLGAALAAGRKTDLAPQRWKGALAGVSTALGQSDRRVVDKDLGRMSYLQRATKDRLNTAAKAQGYRGGNLVHHGTETDNPVTELDFPITIFTPGGNIYGAETQGELESVCGEMADHGYVFYKNRLWASSGDLLTSPDKMRFFGKNQRMYVWNAGATRSGLLTAMDFR